MERQFRLLLIVCVALKGAVLRLFCRIHVFQLAFLADLGLARVFGCDAFGRLVGGLSRVVICWMPAASYFPSCFSQQVSCATCLLAVAAHCFLFFSFGADKPPTRPGTALGRNI
jgi:hypothetical protein